jgi:hypothetical protein|tara:strand:+ start:391 stop:774 length:384 start_codon:yes stop_codon:yes gene_type:complete
MSNRINKTNISKEANATTGHMTVAVLFPEEIVTLVKAIPFKRPAAKRLVEYLSTNPHASTVNVNKNCAIGNISQEANAANRKLYSLGYMIGCMRPPVPLKNRFHQDTAQHLWSLYKLPKEALNDSEY